MRAHHRLLPLLPPISFDRSPSIMMVTPARSGVSVAFTTGMVSIVRSLDARGVPLAWVTAENESFLPGTRGKLADVFLESTHTHLFMIDADMSIDGETLLRMLDTELDYVSCAGVVRGSHKLAIPIDPNSQKNGCYETVRGRCAVTLVKRIVLERMIESGQAPSMYVHEVQHGVSVRRTGYAFFLPIVLDHGEMLAEDDSFSYRAFKSGTRQWVLADANVEHDGVSVNMARLLSEGKAEVTWCDGSDDRRAAE